ncbi:MAG: HDIG domain-containing protein [Deltaproteobacteria bacterium]|nr:HDIG domain-containing protein [Deltaproteobacteria bacterium]
MVALSLVITIMVAPEFSLVPERYKEGDIIPATIIISDNVNLVDERSTGIRRDQTLAEFPPIFDYDLRLKNRIVKSIQDAFQAMRDDLANQRKEQSEAQVRVRNNSLSRIETLVTLSEARSQLDGINKFKRQVISLIAQAKEAGDANPENVIRLEKLRSDLKAVEAQRGAVAQEISQINTKLELLNQEGSRMMDDMKRVRQVESRSIPVMKEKFERTLGISVDDPTFLILMEAQFSPDLEQKTIGLLLPVYDRYVIAARENLDPKRPAIQIKTLDSTKLERFETLDSLQDVPKVREEINRAGATLVFPGDSGSYREAVIALAQRMVQPNLTENKGDTEHRKQELLKNIAPVYFNLKKGDVVARAREQATAHQVEILNALNAYNLANPKYPQIIGTFLVMLLSLLVVQKLISMNARHDESKLSRILLMSLLLLATLGFAQIILLLVPALSMVYDFIPPASFNFLIPAALTSMLAGIVMGFEVAVFLGFIVSLSMAIMLGNSLGFFLYALLGSFVAAIPLKQYESRFALWQQGLRISAINVAMILVLSLLEQKGLDWTIAINAASAALNGLGVALLTATLLPIIENLFDVTTNLKLLELSNMNHPALKELAVRAPGTYHHSIVVGNLSESAAEGIRANPLLVRVSSYYHDLGKMLCPLYFVENQQKRNFHDDLPAHISARIIINHVNDGLEIAHRFKLGRAIMDIIAQHHGSSTVRYFFAKSQQESVELREEPNAENFRYPGPKPQTKEAGLVMVADVTEAATRSISDPSLDSIWQMVQKLTTRVYMEGQLDESGLTFNDLNYIEKTFTKMLISIHHHRISYPELKEGIPTKAMLTANVGTAPVRLLPTQEPGEKDETSNETAPSDPVEKPSAAS